MAAAYNVTRAPSDVGVCLHAEPDTEIGPQVQADVACGDAGVATGA